MADLLRLVNSRLLDPLSILVQSDESTRRLRDEVRANADMWAAQLLGPDERVAGLMAARLIAALYPGDAPFDPPDEWWRTPLGRVTARRLGHPSRGNVSFSVAAAMLGITRQGVHDLTARHKLQRHSDGGVSATSVRDRLAQLSAHRTPSVSERND